MDYPVYMFKDVLLPPLLGNIQIVPTEALTENRIVPNYSPNNSNNANLEVIYTYWREATEVPKHQVGDIILSINPEPVIPTETSVWADWDSIILSHHPELQELVQSFYYRRDCDNPFEREFWEYAISHNCLPCLKDMFIRINSNKVGEVQQGKAGGLNYSMPIVEYMEGYLKPVGYSQDDIPKPVFYSNVEKGNSHKTDLKSDLVLLAQRSQLHKTSDLPTLVQNGIEPIGYPTNINMKVKVCVKSHYVGVPLSHTPIICIETNFNQY